MTASPRIHHSTAPSWSVLAVAVLGAASCRPGPAKLLPSSGGQNGTATAGGGSAGNDGSAGQSGGSRASGGSTGSGGQTRTGGSGGSGGPGGGSAGGGADAADPNAARRETCCALTLASDVCAQAAACCDTLDVNDQARIDIGKVCSNLTRSDIGTCGVWLIKVKNSYVCGVDASVSAPDARDAASVPDVAVDMAPPPPSRGPTPSQTGMKFPFPQNRENGRCVYPSFYRNEDVQAAYDQWKKDTVTSDGAKGFRRVKRPNEPGLEPNSTVSEGIAYGMMIAVYMNDQTLFDDLWQYEQQFIDGRYGLMHWNIKADGSGPADGGVGPATDADEDMAFALVMADKQWGGKGKLAKNYIDIAKETITNVWNNEIFEYKYLKPWPTADSSAINLSYFAPAYYKLFAKIDTKNTSNWTTAVDTMYGVLNASLNSTNGNTDNGLVPAWCDSSGKPNGGAFGPGGPSPTNYQYDSCRTPFRIGLDWCWNGEQRAQAYVAKTSKFFNGITVAKMVDGYDLNGTPRAQYQTGGSAQIQSSAFIGPAGVGAMSNAIYQTFVNDAYGVLITGKALVGGTYYDDSWMVLSLLMMTANFLDYTTYP